MDDRLQFLLSYLVYFCFNLTEFAYHAFIIYSQDDSDWVTGKLLPLLEDEHHLKCCVHYRDFEPGKPFRDSMADSVYRSCKIVAVLSSNFVKSNYCNYELSIAKYRLLNRRDDSLVIIRIDNEDSSKLPKELRKRNFIDYSNLLERPLWEHKLLTFLNGTGDCSDRVELKCVNSSAASPLSNRNPLSSEDEELNRTINTMKNVNETRPFLCPLSQYHNSPEEERETVL